MTNNLWLEVESLRMLGNKLTAGGIAGIDTVGVTTRARADLVEAVGNAIPEILGNGITRRLVGGRTKHRSMNGGGRHENGEQANGKLHFCGVVVMSKRYWMELKRMNAQVWFGLW